MKYIVTGGAGFIGCHLINLLLKNIDNTVVNIDKLTYASNERSSNDFEKNSNYSLHKVDIVDYHSIKKIINNFKPDAIFHLAAESHVDNSIEMPLEFIKTNVLGTSVMIEAANQYWLKLEESKKNKFRFLHVSTDEVYGSLKNKEYFTEETKYDPSSPYSASKAGSDHLVRAWNRTYGLPTLITNCSNNFGPYQHPEKLIPKIIINALNNELIPIYGTGQNERDWLYVEDHVEALCHVIDKGKIGETYNIGSDNQRTNIDITYIICNMLDKKLNTSEYNLDSFSQLITYVEDRPGHDQRYAIDPRKIQNELKWRSKYNFDSYLESTIDWYIKNYGK